MTWRTTEGRLLIQFAKASIVIDFVRNSGGLEYAENVMYQYRTEAFELLEQVPDGAAKTSIMDLVTYVTERKK